MLKRISILLTAAILISMMAVTGCNSSTGGDAAGGGNAAAPAGGKTTVQFWGHVNEAWNLSHKRSVEAFNASQSDIVVEATFFPYDDFEAKIQTSLLSGGEGADLYEIWGGWALDFIGADALSPVPDKFIADLVNDCYPPVLGAFSGDDGKYYGVPLEFNIEYGAMLINKPEFEARGLAYPKTWEEMIATAKATAVSNGEVMEMRGMDFTTKDTVTTMFLSMIMSQGGEYLKDGKFDLNTPEAEKAMQTLVDYVAVDHLTNLDSITEAAGPEIDGHHFLGRNEAMIVPRGPWVISGLAEEYGKEYGVDFDYIEMDFFASEKRFPAETGWGMCVPKVAKAADAAWVYAEYLLEKDNLMQHNIDCAQIPPRKSVAEDPDFVKAMPFAAPELAVLKYGEFIGPFNTDIIKNDLKQYYISLCTNDGTYASVKDALASLTDKLNADLKLG